MKMLIVDDEIQIRTGLQECIDWSHLGLDEVLVAENGVTALDLYKKYHPEIIITDIRMPKMDGLTLIKSVKELSANCKFIILSGYSEFEYAKAALQYMVVDYELKPVNVERLLTLVEKSISAIVREKQQSSVFNEFWNERIFRDLIHNQWVDTPAIQELFTNSINWRAGARLRVCILQMDGRLGCVLKTELEQITTFLKKEVQLVSGMIHMLNNKDYILIMNLENRVFELEKWWRHLNLMFMEQFQTSLSIGISSEGKLPQLPVLYQQAAQAIHLKFYRGPRGSYYYHEVPERKTGQADLYVLPENELRKGFQATTFSGLKACIDHEFTAIWQEQKLSVNEVYDVSKQFLLFADQTVKKMVGSTAQSLDNEQPIMAKLVHADLINECRDLVIQGFNEAYHYLQTYSRSPLNKGMFKAIKYIKSHFDEDITVKEISEHIQQTPNYFSHKFKQEIGMSFTEYLNQVRIEEATKLIVKNANVTLYEISLSVGFRDYKYFTQIFKKQKGLPPSEYQKRYYNL